MENWSSGKRKCDCEGFQELNLNNDALISERAVIPSLHHSSTPPLHKLLKCQQTNSPLGITKAWPSVPGFLPMTLGRYDGRFYERS